ncbi:MAG: hypothetical protein VX438_03450 [Planctomycetota bacterium]|nr:hypothetical protein [Planctomycetota bacterium]
MQWQRTNSSYTFQSGGFSLSANATEMANGIQVQKGTATLLQAFTIPSQDFAETRDSIYCRGADLFSRFEAKHQIAECYWRLQTADVDRITLELIVSLHSRQHSPDPFLLRIENQSKPGWIQSDPNFNHSFYGPNCDASLSIVVHPSDISETKLHSTTELNSISITPCFMEPGVIRRIRLLLEVRNGRSTEQTLTDLMQRFLESPVPLAT